MKMKGNNLDKVLAMVCGMFYSLNICELFFKELSGGKTKVNKHLLLMLAIVLLQ